MIGELPVPVVQTASYPARPGNALRPLVDGEPAFRRVCEAIEAARHSVWATVTFMWADFQMPDGRGSALDVLNRAAARDLDVRLTRLPNVPGLGMKPFFLAGIKTPITPTPRRKRNVREEHADRQCGGTADCHRRRECTRRSER